MFIRFALLWLFWPLALGSGVSHDSFNGVRSIVSFFSLSFWSLSFDHYFFHVQNIWIDLNEIVYAIRVLWFSSDKNSDCETGPFNLWCCCCYYSNEKRKHNAQHLFVFDGTSQDLRNHSTSTKKINKAIVMNLNQMLLNLIINIIAIIVFDELMPESSSMNI